MGDYLVVTCGRLEESVGDWGKIIIRSSAALTLFQGM